MRVTCDRRIVVTSRLAVTGASYQDEAGRCDAVQRRAGFIRDDGRLYWMYGRTVDTDDEDAVRRALAWRST